MNSFFDALNHLLMLFNMFLAKLKREKYNEDISEIKDDPLGSLGNESPRVRDIAEFDLAETSSSDVHQTDD